MQRTFVADLKSGKDVLVKGWVHEIRNLAKMKFLILRDVSGLVQCIVKDSGIADQVSGLTLESVVAIKGTVKKANVKAEFVRSDIELEVTDLEVLNEAETLPIHVNEKTTKTELPQRLDNRSLDLRKPRVKAIFKVQSTIINAFREFFYKRGFIEIQPPGIIATSTEGGTDLFEVKYFDKKAYLAQSPQLYKQLAAISLEKVFSAGPVWRAEKHDTSKHINEIRQMDIEVAFADDKEVMKYQEDAVRYIVERVIEDCKSDLEVLSVKLKVPKTKYLTYKEAVDTLNENGFKMEQGEDFEPEAERKLCEIFPNTLIFTYEWPMEMKPFYIWPKNPDEKVSGGFDALFGGVEISSGGQRVHLPDTLIEQLKSKKLKPENFKWYIDAFRYGAPMHAGWSIGLERFTKAILNLDNIREATMFSRDRKRLTP